MAKKKCESKKSKISKMCEAAETQLLMPQPVAHIGGSSLPEVGEINITLTSNGEVIYPKPGPQDEGFNDFMYDFKKSMMSFQSRVADPMYVYLFAIEVMSKIIPNPSVLSVLDVGCADGVLEFLLQRDYGIRAEGVEISDAGRREFKLNIGREAAASIQNVTGVADVVTAIETLEHVPDHVGLLNEMWKRTDKVLIFTVPREGALDSPDHKHIFNFYDMYDLCDNLNPKPRDFGIYQINKLTKFGNPLNIFGVVIWK